MCILEKCHTQIFSVGSPVLGQVVQSNNAANEGSYRNNFAPTPRHPTHGRVRAVLATVLILVLPWKPTVGSAIGCMSCLVACTTVLHAMHPTSSQREECPCNCYCSFAKQLWLSTCMPAVPSSSCNCRCALHCPPLHCWLRAAVYFVAVPCTAGMSQHGLEATPNVSGNVCGTPWCTPVMHIVTWPLSLHLFVCWTQGH